MPLQRYHWVVRPEGEQHLVAYPDTDSSSVFLRYHGDVDEPFWEVRDSEDPELFISADTYPEAVMAAERVISDMEVA